MAAGFSESDAARSGFTAQQLQNHHSSLLAKTLEYRLLAELTAHLMKSGTVYDVLRGDVDHMGHDVVVEANGVLRHIQLKVKVRGGKTDAIKASLKLADKPSGCIILIHYDPQTLEIGPFGWFGGTPGEPLPDLGDKVALHSKRDGDRVRGERPGQRVVSVRRFEMVDDIATLATRLFGTGSHDELLRAHLREQAGRQAQLLLDRVCPDRLVWANSAEIAHVINGYTLAAKAGLGDRFTLVEPRIEVARTTGSWPGDLLELWVTLFLEHRRWRMASPYGPDEEAERLLDRLCEQIQQALQLDGYLSAI